MVDMAGFLFKSIICILFTVLILTGLAMFLKKRNPFSKSSSRDGFFQILTRLPIGFKRELLLVRIGRRTILIGSTETNITLLGDLDDGEIKGRFQKILSENMSQS